eukprot:TRINITY_DN69896_c0_g1_i1.p1 TRINITY_DN69896_c0_g1~~TRINITY_DN69896_c0_g1_i1.p1  ORF type:complete len:293 (+),score=52.32 TRINITY_DN69896_c0_g1_i1:28-879(+)
MTLSLASWETTGDAVAAWFAAGVPTKNGPPSYTRSWVGTSFVFATTTVTLYLLFALYGYVRLSGSSQEGSVRPLLPGYIVRPLRLAYNLLQVALSIYMASTAFAVAYGAQYSVIPCNPYRVSSPVVADILHVFYLSKVLDFVDTFFIVAEGKTKQFTFLHIFHHASIFSIYWLNIRAFYDGDIYATVLLNSAIHAVMYLYYAVSSYVRVPQAVKQCITLAQCVQFMVMIAQGAYLLVTGCPTAPSRIVALYVAYISYLLVLFLRFAAASYGPSRKGNPKRKHR